jgi:hypothetical protein
VRRAHTGQVVKSGLDGETGRGTGGETGTQGDRPRASTHSTEFLASRGPDGTGPPPHGKVRRRCVRRLSESRGANGCVAWCVLGLLRERPR